jgi:gas vesicle protein
MTNRTYYSREAEMRASRDRMMMTMILIALGLGVGAVLALLFAPQSGAKTRDELGNLIEEGFESGREATNQTLKRLEKDLADLRKKVEERVAAR